MVEPAEAGTAERADATPEAPSAASLAAADGSLPPPDSRALSAEVLAVLVIGFFPNLIATLIYVGQPPSRLPYWQVGLDLFFREAAIIFLVLYLIHRSGEPWGEFGLVRPRVSDLALGLLLFLIPFFAWSFFPSASAADVTKNYPPPRDLVDFAVMLLQNASIGFAEELLFRAYLITRLARLLESKGKAVILAAAFFALGHIHYGPSGVIMPLAMGLAYGVAYLALPRIWPFAIGHMLADIFADLSIPL